MNRVLLSLLLTLAAMTVSAEVYVIEAPANVRVVQIHAWGEVRVRGTSSRTLKMTLTRTARGATTPSDGREPAGIAMKEGTVIAWSDVAGDVELEVPRDAQISVRSFRWGDVSVESMCGDVDITAHEGGVRLHQVGGAAAAHAGNGPIQADLRWAAPHPVSLTSMHGDIQILIPPGIEILPRLRTDDGKIRSDIPWEEALRPGPSQGNAARLTRLFAYTKFGTITLRNAKTNQAVPDGEFECD